MAIKDEDFVFEMVFKKRATDEEHENRIRPLTQSLAKIFKKEGQEVGPCACMGPYCSRLDCSGFWWLLMQNKNQFEKDIKELVELKRSSRNEGGMFHTDKSEEKE